MADADAGDTIEDRAALAPVTVPPWRLPGDDRDAIMAQRAGLIAEVEALQALIASKWLQVNALGKLAGLPPERDRGRRGS